MLYLLEGIRAGLLLSLLVGPLLVLLFQLSLRRGTLAALVAALGIWLSDALFIVVSYYGIGSLDELQLSGRMGSWIGWTGVVILLITALVMWFRPPPDLTGEKKIFQKRGLFYAFLQGFALNTFNPFTVGFWSVFTLTQVHERSLDPPSAVAIFAGILGTIIVTDVIKILVAKKIRGWLKPEIILRAQRIGALVLGVFALVLGYRIW